MLKTLHTNQLTQLIMIIICVIMGFIVLFMLGQTKLKINKLKKDDSIEAPKLREILRARAIILIFISVIAVTSITIQIDSFISLTSTIKTAISHGLTSDIEKMSMADLKDLINNSPKESKLPDDIEGVIIIYYRFDCPDCRAIYNDLASAVANTDNVYWISSRSETGKSLLDKYPVDEVPTGIYIRHDTYNGNVTFTKYELATTDENENTILDTSAIDRLLYLQSENR